MFSLEINFQGLILVFMLVLDKKFEVVAKVKEYAIAKGYQINDIDGVRVTFDDGWALVRCSNTGPNITARFEATTDSRLQEIEKEFTELVEKYNR